ncbi:hypothetical protein C9374_000792 [Naegleria lovaniensis]|uniref:Uncharacterized protein n=1 Tax=Naegleria lovaniensis TaxID=51637 RepID=A0AA88KSE4_NAELO|nr:uncharacterized protein C9374_000792 [Naegleria lovaniensis]KAG2387942.1 hypothetical protein C9374_000792 [Naegleria lovaniensis]
MAQTHVTTDSLENGFNFSSVHQLSSVYSCKGTCNTLFINITSFLYRGFLRCCLKQDPSLGALYRRAFVASLACVALTWSFPLSVLTQFWYGGERCTPLISSRNVSSTSTVYIRTPQQVFVSCTLHQFVFFGASFLASSAFVYLFFIPSDNTCFLLPSLNEYLKQAIRNGTSPGQWNTVLLHNFVFEERFYKYLLFVIGVCFCICGMNGAMIVSIIALKIFQFSNSAWCVSVYGSLLCIVIAFLFSCIARRKLLNEYGNPRNLRNELMSMVNQGTEEYDDAAVTKSSYDEFITEKDNSVLVAWKAEDGMNELRFVPVFVSEICTYLKGTTFQTRGNINNGVEE